MSASAGGSGGAGGGKVDEVVVVVVGGGSVVAGGRGAVADVGDSPSCSGVGPAGIADGSSSTGEGSVTYTTSPGWIIRLSA